MNENTGHACIICCPSDDQLDRHRHRPADNIKMFFAVIHLAQDKD